MSVAANVSAGAGNCIVMYHIFIALPKVGMGRALFQQVDRGCAERDESMTTVFSVDTPACVRVNGTRRLNDTPCEVLYGDVSAQTVSNTPKYFRTIQAQRCKPLRVVEPC